MEKGRLADAEATLKLAIEEHRNADNPGGVAIASSQLAEVLIKEGKLDESKEALDIYDEVLKPSKEHLISGENVIERGILAALVDAADGKSGRAQREASQAAYGARTADQGSMLMKAQLVLGEIELQGANKASGRRDLESLVDAAESKGFGLISHEAKRAMTDRSRADVQSLGSLQLSARK